MTSSSIVAWLPHLAHWGQQYVQTQWPSRSPGKGSPLDAGRFPSVVLPSFVKESAVAMRYLHLLGPLAWEHFPERDLATPWNIPACPYQPFIAACLVKLDQQLPYMAHLRRYLVEHPALVWLLGFPLVPSWRFPWGFDVEASLPTARHFTRMLREVPQTCLQWLLDETVRLLRTELSPEISDFGQAVSLDTKHILAWVRENNPKEYVKRRYVKEQQPAGDPDCRLGCKRRSNQYRARASSETPPATPMPRQRDAREAGSGAHSNNHSARASSLPCRARAESKACHSPPRAKSATPATASASAPGVSARQKVSAGRGARGSKRAATWERATRAAGTSGTVVDAAELGHEGASSTPQAASAAAVAADSRRRANATSVASIHSAASATGAFR